MGFYGALFSAGASAWQAWKANKAAEAAAEAGREGKGYIEAAEPQARGELNRGFDEAGRYIGLGQQILRDNQADNERAYRPEIEVGQTALERLNAAILKGDQSAVQVDPGYQFRLDEGNKAIERAAAAAGSFGGGGNLKDFARFSQGIASDEYGKSISRLMALQNVGSRANNNLVSLNSGTAANLANYSIHQANNETARGGALASLTTNTATARSNALTGSTNAVNNFNLAAANANAQGIAAIGRGIDDAGMTFAELYAGGAFNKPKTGGGDYGVSAAGDWNLPQNGYGYRYG